MASTLLNLTNQSFPSGTTTSSNFTMPAGAVNYIVQFTFPTAELNDSTLTMTGEIDHQIGGVFQLDSQFSWQAGTINPKTGTVGQPSFGVDDVVPGDIYRAKVTFNKAVTGIGITVTSN